MKLLISLCDGKTVVSRMSEGAADSLVNAYISDQDDGVWNLRLDSNTEVLIRKKYITSISVEEE